jgi:hypothetical protein
MQRRQSSQHLEKDVATEVAVGAEGAKTVAVVAAVVEIEIEVTVALEGGPKHRSNHLLSNQVTWWLRHIYLLHCNRLTQELRHRHHLPRFHQ